jgi:hypothetical protein
MQIKHDHCRLFDIVKGQSLTEISKRAKHQQPNGRTPIVILFYTTPSIKDIICTDINNQLKEARVQETKPCAGLQRK